MGKGFALRAQPVRQGYEPGLGWTRAGRGCLFGGWQSKTQKFNTCFSFSFSYISEDCAFNDDFVISVNYDMDFQSVITIYDEFHNVSTLKIFVYLI